MKDDRDLREKYGHFLDTEEDVELLHLVRDLDALGQTAGPLPQEVDAIGQVLQKHARARLTQGRRATSAGLLPRLRTYLAGSGAPAGQGGYGRQSPGFLPVASLILVTALAVAAAATLLLNAGGGGGEAARRPTDPPSEEQAARPPAAVGPSRAQATRERQRDVLGGRTDAACPDDQTDKPVTRVEDWGGPAPTLGALDFYTAHAAQVAVVKVEGVRPGRWDTANGCKPPDLRNIIGMTSGSTAKGFRVEDPFIYRPVALTVEQAIVDAESISDGAEYRLYGGAAGSYTVRVNGGEAPPQRLVPGGRYLLIARPLIKARWHVDGHDATTGKLDPRALIVTQAFEIDGQGRVRGADGGSEPLAEVVRLIRQVRATAESPPLEEFKNILRFDGIIYDSMSLWTKGSSLSPDDVGPEYAKVRRDVDTDGMGSIEEALERDGDSSGLAPGTPVYTVKGYSPRFTLAAYAYGRVYQYHAAINPGAKRGGDLLDIEGRVRSIRIEHWDHTIDRPKLVREGEITDPALVKRLVGGVLAAPLRLTSVPYEMSEPLYEVVFKLEDGTSVAYNYWPRQGELAHAGLPTNRAIEATREFRAAVEEALGR